MSTTPLRRSTGAQRPARRLSAPVLALGVAAALGLTACGSNSLSSNPSSTGSAAPAGSTGSTGSAGSGVGDGGGASPAPQQVDKALAAKVPAKITSAGVITVGTDTTYPPNEFLGPDGKTAQGMDVDLITAVGQVLGVKVAIQPSNFDAIILGVSSGKYDIGMSSFTINADRLKQVNMVSYYEAGTLWATAKGNPKGINPDDICGKNIGVQKGTVQVDDVNARSKKCTDAGKPAVNLFVDEQQVKVTTALVSGKVDAMAADSPIVIDAVAKSGGALQKLGEIYDAAPYGVVVPKAQTEFAQAIAGAMGKLKVSGAYDQILAKWQGQDGAVSSFVLNPAP